MIAALGLAATIAFAGRAAAGYIWVQDGPLNLANSGPASTGHADPSAVVLPDGRIRLYYQPGVSSSVSTDGVNFTLEPGARLNTGNNARVVAAPNGGWRMFYVGSDFSYVHSAYSPDGLNWTVEPGQRLTASSIGATTINVFSQLVALPGGGWRAYVSDKSGVPMVPGNVYSATSPDQLTWTPDAGVRLGVGQGPQVLARSAGHPDIVTNTDGSVTIYYGDHVACWTNDGEPTPSIDVYPGYDTCFKIYSATAKDGLNFLPSGPLLFSESDPSVVVTPDGIVHAYFDAINRTTGITTIYAAHGIPAVIPDSGWWWNPAEGGRGYSIEVNALGHIFFGAFMYASDGSPIWYVAQGSMAADGSFSAPLNIYGNGLTLTGSQQPRGAVLTGSAGQVSARFTSNTTGTLTLPGSAPISIQRFDFTTAGAAGGPAPTMADVGWYWNAAQGGRGYFMEWQGTALFMAAYMYDPQGRPAWYSSTLLPQSSTQFAGHLTQYNGGQILGGGYQAPPTSTDLGAISVQIVTLNTAGVTVPPPPGTIFFPTRGHLTLTLPNAAQLDLTRFGF